MEEQKKYRFITYQGTNFKMSVTKIDYYHPHFHKEVEICLLIYGNYAVTSDGNTIYAKPGDFWIINPYSVHEYQCLDFGKRAIMLELQLHENFFTEYYPQMRDLQFPFEILNGETIGEMHYRNILRTFLTLGNSYFRKDPFYQLEAAGLINLLLYQILLQISCKKIRSEQHEQTSEKAGRMKELTDYVMEHYQETLYLSDIADQLGISMSRLSHVFHDIFGISFQEYLQKIRCEKAGEYLRNTDMKILDISIACGFSDPKYLNQAFTKLYGRKPREYRNEFLSKNQNEIRENTDDYEVFCDDEHALAILEYCGMI